MKLDASRYRQATANLEEFRLHQMLNLEPVYPKDSFLTFGRRRGLAFHQFSEGLEPNPELGDAAVIAARFMHEANLVDPTYQATKILWREREFEAPIPGTGHSMVGRVDALAERDGEVFVWDYKTTKHRTKSDFDHYINELRQNPQVSFYLTFCPEAKYFVYRVLSINATRKGGPKVEIREIEVRRSELDLRFMQRSVAMVCDIIEFLVDKYGIEFPWPIPSKVGGELDNYEYASLFGKYVAPGAEYEGFTTREEHLDCLKESR